MKQGQRQRRGAKARVAKLDKAGALALAWLALCVFAGLLLAGPSYGAPTNCPEKPKELKEPSCDGSKQECQQCKEAIRNQKEAMKRFEDKVKECKGMEASCSSSIMVFDEQGIHFPQYTFTRTHFWMSLVSEGLCRSAEAAVSPDSVTGQAPGMETSADKYNAMKKCMGKASAMDKEAAKIADDCVKALKVCKGVSGADDAQKVCQKAKEDATKKGEEADKKGNEADKNAKKNEDNAKKEKSDGGMPQIPPMQPPQDDKQDPQQQATSPTPDPTPQTATASKTETENNKFGESSASPTVGLGTDKTDPATSTIASPGGSGYAMHDASPDRFRDSNGTGASGAPPLNIGSVGSGGGGGVPNGSGASQPGEGKAPESKETTYEMNPGGGGKLGAPKGFKGGGDSDTAVAEAAKDAFKADLGVDARAPAGVPAAANPEDDPENGYTVFKMVRYRYAELKKRGNL